MSHPVGQKLKASLGSEHFSGPFGGKARLKNFERFCKSLKKFESGGGRSNSTPVGANEDDGGSVKSNTIEFRGCSDRNTAVDVSDDNRSGDELVEVKAAIKARLKSEVSSIGSVDVGF